MKKDRLQTYGYLRKNAWNGIWGKRILAETGFLLEVSKATGGSLDGELLPQIEALREAFDRDGAITKASALAAEDALAPLGKAAKAYEITCSAHAHIDMNWMWGFQETAAVTVDTFRTMLQLMEEYPEFTFSQSQASVYRIIEEYCPEMLEQIRRRVHEGRWEVTASSWVENDKNMSGGEAMARHLLYTRRYLSRLLQIDEDSVKLDFEPDTFGHTANLPEILQNGGVKYYYHCRGLDTCHIYNWKAPSGAQVLVFRDPAWYNQTIDYDLFLNVPAFCEKYGTKQYLKVYGVGDHGGGPTRRDLNRLTEMAAWPLFPTIRFGTMHSFFEKLEADRDQFETIDRELNYVFTGCYTSQSRIKRANRMGEDRLNESETLDAMAKALCESYRTAGAFEPAWRRVLFNQFHDILPGSGVTETREYAMGEFQKVLATADINANHAMQALCAAMNTSSLASVGESPLSVGGGVGFGTADGDGYRFPAAERGNGSVRIYTLFNPTQYDRSGVSELTVWDWPDNPNRLIVTDSDGGRLPAQVTESGTHYWGHHYHRVAVCAQIPAFGYTSVVLQSKPEEHVAMPLFDDPRCDVITDGEIVLENSRIRAVFCPNTMQLYSLVQKSSGRELIDPRQPACAFRLITEETSNGMTAWRVGKYARVQNLNESCPVTVSSVVRGDVRQQISYSMPFASSSLKATVTLDAESELLRFDAVVDWHELGSPNAGIPQLNFALPLAQETPVSRCVVPFGVSDRPALAQDVPCSGLIAPALQNGDTVALLSDCKYGFRNDGHGLSVSLIRGSYDPDPTPEIGVHTMALGVAVVSSRSADLLRCSDCFSHPVSACANTSHSGSLAPNGKFLSVCGAKLSAVKQAEDGSGLILRFYNPENTAAEARVIFQRVIRAAETVSVTECPSAGACLPAGNLLTVQIAPHGIATVHVTL